MRILFMIFVGFLSLSSVAGKHESPPHKKGVNGFYKCDSSHSLEGGVFGAPWNSEYSSFRRYGPRQSACSSAEWTAITFSEFKWLATEWHKVDWNKAGRYWNNDRSLCNANEKVMFSCHIKEKLVSLCATPEMTTTTGRLTYRFGLFGKVAELSYPMENIPPAQAFRKTTLNWSHRNFRALSFEIKDNTYSLYWQNADFVKNDHVAYGAGMLVHKGTAKIADMWCKEPIQDTIFREVFDHLMLPEYVFGERLPDYNFE